MIRTRLGGARAGRGSFVRGLGRISRSPRQCAYNFWGSRTAWFPESSWSSSSSPGLTVSSFIHTSPQWSHSGKSSPAVVFQGSSASSRQLPNPRTLALTHRSDRETLRSLTEHLQSQQLHSVLRLVTRLDSETHARLHALSERYPKLVYESRRLFPLQRILRGAAQGFVEREQWHAAESLLAVLRALPGVELTVQDLAWRIRAAAGLSKQGLLVQLTQQVVHLLQGAVSREQRWQERQSELAGPGRAGGRNRYPKDFGSGSGPGSNSDSGSGYVSARGGPTEFDFACAATAMLYGLPAPGDLHAVVQSYLSSSAGRRREFSPFVAASLRREGSPTGFYSSDSAPAWEEGGRMKTKAMSDQKTKKKAEEEEHAAPSDLGLSWETFKGTDPSPSADARFRAMFTPLDICLAVCLTRGLVGDAVSSLQLYLNTLSEHSSRMVEAYSKLGPDQVLQCQYNNGGISFAADSVHFSPPSPSSSSSSSSPSSSFQSPHAYMTLFRARVQRRAETTLRILTDQEMWGPAVGLTRVLLEDFGHLVVPRPHFCRPCLESCAATGRWELALKVGAKMASWQRGKPPPVDGSRASTTSATSGPRTPGARSEASEAYSEVPGADFEASVASAKSQSGTATPPGLLHAPRDGAAACSSPSATGKAKKKRGRVGGSASSQDVVKSDQLLLLLRTAVAAGREREAVDIFAKLRRDTREGPRRTAYDLLLRQTCRKGELRGAQFLLDKMQAEGLQPGFFTAAYLFDVPPTMLREAWRLWKPLVLETMTRGWMSTPTEPRFSQAAAATGGGVGSGERGGGAEPRPSSLRSTEERKEFDFLWSYLLQQCQGAAEWELLEEIHRTLLRSTNELPPPEAVDHWLAGVAASKGDVDAAEAALGHWETSWDGLRQRLNEMGGGGHNYTQARGEGDRAYNVRTSLDPGAANKGVLGDFGVERNGQRPPLLIRSAKIKPYNSDRSPGTSTGKGSLDLAYAAPAAATAGPTGKSDWALDPYEAPAVVLAGVRPPVDARHWARVQSMLLEEEEYARCLKVFSDKVRDAIECQMMALPPRLESHAGGAAVSARPSFTATVGQTDSRTPMLEEETLHRTLEEEFLRQVRAEEEARHGRGATVNKDINVEEDGEGAGLDEQGLSRSVWGTTRENGEDRFESSSDSDADGDERAANGHQTPGSASASFTWRLARHWTVQDSAWWERTASLSARTLLPEEDEAELDGFGDGACTGATGGFGAGFGVRLAAGLGGGGGGGESGPSFGLELARRNFMLASRAAWAYSMALTAAMGLGDLRRAREIYEHAVGPRFRQDSQRESSPPAEEAGSNDSSHNVSKLGLTTGEETSEEERERAVIQRLRRSWLQPWLDNVFISAATALLALEDDGEALLALLESVPRSRLARVDRAAVREAEEFLLRLGRSRSASWARSSEGRELTALVQRLRVEQMDEERETRLGRALRRRREREENESSQGLGASWKEDSAFSTDRERNLTPVSPREAKHRHGLVEDASVDTWTQIFADVPEEEPQIERNVDSAPRRSRYGPASAPDATQ